MRSAGRTQSLETVRFTSAHAFAKASCARKDWKLKLQQGFDDFQRGHWTALLDDSEKTPTASRPSSKTFTEEEDLELRGEAALRSIQVGEVSRARHRLTGAKLAPKTDETFNSLQDKRPMEQHRPIPAHVMSHDSDEPVKIDRKILASQDV